MPAPEKKATWAEEMILGNPRQSVPQKGRVHLHITILFEFFYVTFTFLIRKTLNHVTVIAENSWEFPRGILSGNCVLQEKTRKL